MKIDINGDKLVCKGIAQGLSPFDTGNTRYNAIKDENTPNGFRIRYSLQDAFYIYFLEEGTKFSTMHRGFIGLRTVPAIANYLYNKYQINNAVITKKYESFASIAQSDLVNENTKSSYSGITRDQRNKQSLALDIESTAKQYGWESGEKPLVSDWKEREFI